MKHNSKLYKKKLIVITIIILIYDYIFMFVNNLLKKLLLKKKKEKYIFNNPFRVHHQPFLCLQEFSFVARIFKKKKKKIIK